MPFTNGHALLIGVDTYANAPWMNVSQTGADAQAIGQVLVDPQRCGYPADQVVLLNGARATRAGIFAALDALAARAGADDTVLLFYAGHGLDGDDGAYHLTTFDARLGGAPGRRHVVAGSAVGQSELLTRLRAIKANRMLMLFNACHAGNISPTTLAEAEPPITGRSLPEDMGAALLATGSGRIIITACRPQQFSFVGRGARTIFGQTLFDTLQGHNVDGRRGFISAYDLYNALYSGVGDAVREQIA